MFLGGLTHVTLSSYSSVTPFLWWDDIDKRVDVVPLPLTRVALNCLPDAPAIALDGVLGLDVIGTTVGAVVAVTREVRVLLVWCQWSLRHARTLLFPRSCVMV